MLQVKVFKKVLGRDWVRPTIRSSCLHFTDAILVPSGLITRTCRQEGGTNARGGVAVDCSGPLFVRWLRVAISPVSCPSYPFVPMLDEICPTERQQRADGQEYLCGVSTCVSSFTLRVQTVVERKSSLVVGHVAADDWTTP